MGGRGWWTGLSIRPSSLVNREGFLSLLDSFLFYVDKCLSACVSVHGLCAWCMGRSEEGAGFPRAGVTDGCEPSDMDSGIRTWALWKSST